MSAHGSVGVQSEAIVSRRGLITMAGTLGVAAVVGSAVAADEKSPEHCFEGESTQGKFDEALDKALAKLDDALGQSGISDAMADWKILEVTGRRGGIAAFHSLKVKISATGNLLGKQ